MAPDPGPSGEPDVDNSREQWHCRQLPGARVVCEREDLLGEVERLRAALTRIANEDYRGPRPQSATLAWEALHA